MRADRQAWLQALVGAVDAVLAQRLVYGQGRVRRSRAVQIVADELGVAKNTLLAQAVIASMGRRGLEAKYLHGKSFWKGASERGQA